MIPSAMMWPSQGCPHQRQLNDRYCLIWYGQLNCELNIPLIFVSTQLQVFCYSHGKLFDKMGQGDHCFSSFWWHQGPLPLCSAVSVGIKLKPESSGHSNFKKYIQMWQRDTLSFLWFLLGFRKLPRNSPANLLLTSHWPESRCIQIPNWSLPNRMSFVFGPEEQALLRPGWGVRRLWYMSLLRKEVDP